MFTPWLTSHGTVEASTYGGLDAFLLDQQIDGRLALAYSLQTTARVRLAAILSADEALCGLGTFAFVASHLFSTGGWHSSAVAELLRLITRLEELHTEVQGMISSPHLATTVLFYMLRRWILYLNRCAAASASESLGATGCWVPFSLEPIMDELEGGQYSGPILSIALGYLVSRAIGRGDGGGGGGGGGGSGGGGGGGGGGDGDGGNGSAKKRKSSTTGGYAMVWMRYDTHLPALYLWGGENSRSILADTVLPTLHGAVLCKKWHLYRSYWEDCEKKRSRVPTPTEVATTVDGLLKASRGI